MLEKSNRRRFMQASLAAGASLTVGGASISHSHSPEVGLAAWAANPNVRPGRVAWHADFEAACRASAQSGKPVFLFHMLGRLDERFC